VYKNIRLFLVETIVKQHLPPHTIHKQLRWTKETYEETVVQAAQAKLGKSKRNAKETPEESAVHKAVQAAHAKLDQWDRCYASGWGTGV
jgi:hypothetical protein